MITDVADICACVIVAVCIWIRRATLRASKDTVKLTERAMTTALILMLAALILMAPVTDVAADRALHALTGQWNLNDWAAHCLFIGAAGLFGVNLGSRLAITCAQLRAGFQYYFALPMTVVTMVMLALLTQSPTVDSGRCVADMFACRTGVWIDAYWTVLCGFLLYLCAVLRPVLRLLRAHPRHRSTARLYTLAGTVGAVVCVVRIITAWIGQDMHPVLWAGCYTVAAVLAVAAARSWRRRIRGPEGKQLLQRL